MKHILFIILLSFAISGKAQPKKAPDLSLALQKKADLKDADAKWNALTSNLNVSFATTDKRFPRELPAEVEQSKLWDVVAWKGEKVHTQIVLSSKVDLSKIKVKVSDLEDRDGNEIDEHDITVGLLKYVITDEFGEGCPKRKSSDFDSSYVADQIDPQFKSFNIAAKNTQPLWISVKVPFKAKPGVYHGKITIKADKTYKLKVMLTVLKKTLPTPNKWKYDLDLWQHPAAIARVHNVPLWSKEHYKLMRPYYTMLANAGQKSITASIVDEPWGHQTYDDYPSLIKWTKKTDGTWKYDYDLFDDYIRFVMSCGITSRINCYSMVPWKINFTYFDETTGKTEVFTKAIGTPEYNEFWRTMLLDFTKHLKSRKWFDQTYIAMDERAMKDMMAVIKLLKEVDPQWKIALAGDYHPEIEKDIDYYCVGSKFDFSDEVLARRKQEGKISTWYTCCVEPYPNGFSFSSPAEHVWMGWYTANKNLDGYLRWAYNSFTKDPLIDTRFTAWPAGDTYQVYPGPLSSVRFEKLLEGAQDFEKIKYLQELYSKKKGAEKLEELNEALKGFEIKSLTYTTTAEDQLKKVKHLLNPAK